MGSNIRVGADVTVPTSSRDEIEVWDVSQYIENGTNLHEYGKRVSAYQMVRDTGDEFPICAETYLAGRWVVQFLPSF